MRTSHWRERREQYLKERGRWSDLIREGFVAAPPLGFTAAASATGKAQQSYASPIRPHGHENQQLSGASL